MNLHRSISKDKGNIKEEDNMDRKELMTRYLDGGKLDRVPVSFWYHFVSFHDHHCGLTDPTVLPRVIAGQKKAYLDMKPDLVKIMSDGFFGHPAMTEGLISTTDDVKRISRCGENHPWIVKQVEYVSEITNFVNGEAFTYYNIFSPLQYIRLKFEEYDEDMEKFCRLFRSDPEAMEAAGREIAADVSVLIDKLFSETNVDGIYYSVQSLQDKSLGKDFHDKYVRPLDLLILDKILKYTDNIILHICGYGNYTNDLRLYRDYPAKIFNWATHSEHVSLKEGKEILEHNMVLGGFDNSQGSILYSGSYDDLKKYVYELLDSAGTDGVILGADCTISADIDKNRLEYIRKIAQEYVSEH